MKRNNNSTSTKPNRHTNRKTNTINEITFDLIRVFKGKETLSFLTLNIYLFKFYYIKLSIISRAIIIFTTHGNCFV